MARYVCSWCGKYLNDIVFEGDKNSHGICVTCMSEVKKEFEKVKQNNESIDKKVVKK